jgi:hypothetical protein
MIILNDINGLQNEEWRRSNNKSTRAMQMAVEKDRFLIVHSGLSWPELRVVTG